MAQTGKCHRFGGPSSCEALISIIHCNPAQEWGLAELVPPVFSFGQHTRRLLQKMGFLNGRFGGARGRDFGRVGRGTEGWGTIEAGTEKCRVGRGLANALTMNGRG